jgi:hypothetical protein
MGLVQLLLYKEGETRNTTNHFSHDIPCLKQTYNDCTMGSFGSVKKNPSYGKFENKRGGWNGSEEVKMCVCAALRQSRDFLLLSFTHRTNTIAPPSEQHFLPQISYDIHYGRCMSNINTQ